MNNLQQACINFNKHWIDELPENPPEPQYSEKYKRFERKLLDKMRDDRYHYFTTKTVRVMLVAAVLIVAMTVTVFAVPQLRAYILNELSDHAIFQSMIESDEKVNSEIDCGYIPDGFEVTDEYYGYLYYTKIYENQDGLHFSINKFENGAEMGFDNEDAQITTIQSDGKEYKIYEKANGDIRIVWCDLDYTYRLDGNISYDEALKIAENIK